MLLNATIRRARRQGRSEAQIMVVAWNEWTEQAVLEPSDRYGFGYLEALRKSLKNWGQYHYEGPADLWRQGPRIPQLRLGFNAVRWEQRLRLVMSGGCWRRFALKYQLESTPITPVVLKHLSLLPFARPYARPFANAAVRERHAIVHERLVIDARDDQLARGSGERLGR